MTDWREATVQQKNSTTVTLLKGPLPTMDFSAVSKAIGSPLAGVLGVGILGRYVIKIDYSAGKINFFDPHEFHYSGTGQAFPLEGAAGYLVMKAQVTLADCTVVPVRLFLDSGSNSDLVMNQTFFAAHPHLELRKLDPRSMDAGGTSLDGSLGNFNALTIGSYSLAVPDVTILHSDGSKTSDRISDGTLGSEVFQMFILYIDRLDGKIIFEPRTDRPLVPPKPCVTHPSS